MRDPGREAVKKREILDFLHSNVFDSILGSPKATDSLMRGVRLTLMRMNERDSAGIVQYYWSAIIGTERSTEFARCMRQEGFTRFEEVIDEFRVRFGDAWLRS
jgi:hypothetical protein